VKLLVDMNLSPRWVRRLADAGIDATHWTAVGASNAADTEIMDYARAHG
jgi:predicted nuclease of predicted toxin-antitoxin system